MKLYSILFSPIPIFYRKSITIFYETAFFRDCRTGEVTLSKLNRWVSRPIITQLPLINFSVYITY